MRKIFTISTILICAATMQLSAQRSLLSNYGVSLNAGLSGIGVTASTVLHKNINVRLGYEFGIVPSVKGNFRDFGQIDTEQQIDGENIYVQVPDLEVSAKLRVGGGFHMLFDYTPFKQGMGAFHITAGFYVGHKRLLEVNGQFDKAFIDELHSYGVDPATAVMVDFGNTQVRMDATGHVKAYLAVNSFKPYLGIGWGNAIPKGRVGFRFDIGAMYHGTPKLKSPNIHIGHEDVTNEIDDVYKVIQEIKFYPQISFQLTYRILKEAKYRKPEHRDLAPDALN